MAQAAADNDILLKGSWYGFLRQLVVAIPSKPSETLILGEAKYVVGRRLQKKSKSDPGAAQALAVFNAALLEFQEAEPSAEEVSLAALFEQAAQQAGLPLDPGESLLCAVAIRRDLKRIATGDKRAICALETMVQGRDELKKLEGRLVCLEQLLVRVLADGNPPDVRNAICSQPKVDMALANCFRSPDPSQWTEGLASYIKHLRAGAPTLLEH